MYMNVSNLIFFKMRKIAMLDTCCIWYSYRCCCI